MYFKEVQENLYLGNLEALEHFYGSEEPVVIFSFLESKAELENFLDEKEINRPDHITNYLVVCSDSPKDFEQMSKAFLAAREEMKSAIASGQKVFVHCKHGLHRSPTILALLLKIDFGLDYKSIFDQMRSEKYIPFISSHKNNIINYSPPETINSEDLPKLQLVQQEETLTKQKAPETEKPTTIEEENDSKLARNILIICLCVPVSWIPLALFWLVNTIKHNDYKAPARVWEKTIDNIFKRKWSKSPVVSESHEIEQNNEIDVPEQKETKTN